MKCLCDVFLHVYACLYMMMHDVVFVCFLCVIMNVPIYNFISHLIHYTTEESRNMCECDGFKCSNHLFSAQELSKEERITYPIVVVQLRNTEMRV